MGIASRLVKIFKADLHGVMDQLEDPGLLLKQYLRDMEDALEQKKHSSPEKSRNGISCKKSMLHTTGSIRPLTGI